jgi:hypothetical protein
LSHLIHWLAAWSPERKARGLVFGGVFAVALSFAIFTQHAWEDYYITYRVSKNLATGHGLVFTVGERVHVFTSPLNVLIPAALSVITGNRSDELVLWLFRIVSAALLAGAAVLLFDSARKNAFSLLPMAVLVGLFGLDPKIVDFSINGQETGFMMFFLALAFHTLTVRSDWAILRLGLAGAGLMWTRPDGFIYLVAMGVGFLLFNGSRPAGLSRLGLLKVLLAAAALTTVAYLPWLLWAWHYYGSPVPHTIVAKGIFREADPLDPEALVINFFTFPLAILRGATSADYIFQPSYAFTFGGWPAPVLFYCKCLGYICALYWIVPSGRPQGRAASFAFMLSLFYLSYIVPYPSPWYLPNYAIFAIFVFGHMVQHGLDAARSLAERRPAGARFLAVGVRGLAVVLLSASFLLLLASACEFRVQRLLVEEGNRRPIGLWLRQHAASPRDSVFLEPLGYIGYFSQLKMLDYPGLSAPEVVATERRLKSINYAALIPALHPDWLVLRSCEVEGLEKEVPGLLTESYSAAKVFDVSDRLASYRWLPGRGYLEYDARYIVFKRNRDAGAGAGRG